MRCRFCKADAVTAFSKRDGVTPAQDKPDEKDVSRVEVVAFCDAHRHEAAALITRRPLLASNGRQ
jgi:hypothetical protein